MLAGEIRRDKNIFFALLEILTGFAEEAKSLWSDFEESVDINRFTGEFEGLAIPLIALIFARAVAADPALSLPSVVISAIAAPAIFVTVAVTIAASVTAVAIAVVALIGGLLATGGR